MALTPPSSMDDLFYFTNRATEDGGKIKAWVYKPASPSGKGKLGKPVDPKTGKVKSRATIYVDDDGKEYDKAEIDPTLSVEIQYTCPFCKKSGEATSPYKRKTWKGVPSYVFECNDCGEKIGITKKMKAAKKKKVK